MHDNDNDEDFDHIEAKKKQANLYSLWRVQLLQNFHSHEERRILAAQTQKKRRN